MSPAQTTTRASWIREEIILIEEMINHARAVASGQPTAIERSRSTTLESELRQLQDELSDLESGGRIDLRLTGAPIQGNLIEASTLAEVMQPMKRLLEHLAAEAFVSTRPGSFVLEISSAPQQQFPGTARRIEPVGLLLSDVVDAASSMDLDGAVESAVEDLSLDGVRAVTALIGSLRSNKLNVDVSWVNSNGFRRSGRLDVDRAVFVHQALQHTESSRSTYDVVGELRGLTLEGRRTFQIREDDGTIVTGLVTSDAAPSTLGFSIGERVVAKVEETSRRRLAASGATTSRRLVALHRL